MKPVVTNLVGAIVINPRSGEPFLCCVGSTPSADFHIWRFSGVNEGMGEFDNEPDNKSHIPAKISGYPRVHMHGVKAIGVGNGTALYVAAAAIAAVSNFRDEAGFSQKGWPVITGIDGAPLPGISSAAPRSAEANNWWINATILGLARKQDFDARVEEEVDRCIGGSKALSAARDWFDIDPDDVQSLEACVRGTVLEGEMVRGNVLRIDEAMNANLVVGMLSVPLSWPSSKHWIAVPSDIQWKKRPDWFYFNREAARAANVGIFRTMDQGREAFELWTKLLLTAGISQDDFEFIRERYTEAFDIDSSAVMGVDDPRRNPTPRTLRDPFAGIVKSYAPPARRNPASPRSGDPRIERARLLAEERRRLGWDKLAQLP